MEIQKINQVGGNTDLKKSANLPVASPLDIISLNSKKTASSHRMLNLSSLKAAAKELGSTCEMIKLRKELWKYKTEGWISSSPCLSHDGKIIFVGSGVTADGKVYAIHTKSGRKKWSFQTGGEVKATPCLSHDGKTLFIGSDDRRVYALDTQSGEKKWEFKTRDAVCASPRLSPDGKTIFIGSREENAYAIDAETGEKKWEFPHKFCYSPVISHDGKTLFFGSVYGTQKIHAVHIKSGRKKWGFETIRSVKSSPRLSNDGKTLFVGCTDEKVYALDTVSGREKWSFQTGDSVWSSPCLSHDGKTLFFGSRDGNVYALELRTKEEAIEEARKETKEEINKAAEENKIVKGDNFTTIGSITVPVNQMYKNLAGGRTLSQESWR